MSRTTLIEYAGGLTATLIATTLMARTARSAIADAIASSNGQQHLLSSTTAVTAALV
jgi:hypothetical protein